MSQVALSVTVRRIVDVPIVRSESQEDILMNWSAAP